MISLGLALLVLGWLLVNFMGVKAGRLNAFDYAGATLGILGGLLFSAGIIKLAWVYLP